MSVSNDDESAATSSGERHRLLDLRKTLRLNVDFGPGIEGLSPCVVKVIRGVPKCDVVVELRELLS